MSRYIARRCRAPKFGQIASISDELLEFECKEGFSLIGEQSGICNKTTGKHDANVACIRKYSLLRAIYQLNYSTGVEQYNHFISIFSYG